MCAGGWGRCESAHASLSATADALRVLVLAEAKLDQAALLDVREFVIRHLERQLSDELRGDLSTHQLSGAVRIDCDLHLVGRGGAAVRADERYRGLVNQAARELFETLWDAETGGWPPRPGHDADAISTYHAVWAAEVLTEHGTTDDAQAQQIEKAYTAGHRFLIKEASRRGTDGTGQLWWSQYAHAPSIAATSLAVASLATGDAAPRQAARAGAAWLQEQMPKKKRVGDVYKHHWEYMHRSDDNAFFPITAIGALAHVMADPQHAPAPVPTFVAEAVADLDAMWVDSASAWDRDHADGRKAFVGTSRTILTLSRMLERHGHDWDDIVRSRPRRTHRPVAVTTPDKPSLHRAMRVKVGLRTWDVDGMARTLRLSPSQLDLISALHAKGNESVTLVEAAAILAQYVGREPVSPDTIRTYAEKLRRTLREQWDVANSEAFGFPIEPLPGHVRACWQIVESHEFDEIGLDRPADDRAD